MTRLTQTARRWCLIGLMAWPLLAQAGGCGLTDQQLRQTAATAVSAVTSTVTGLMIGQGVNKLLNVPPNPFASLMGRF